MIFGHSLVLTAQELQLKPPCKEDLWSATSPVEWQRRLQSQHKDEQEELGFIETLRIFINEPQSAKEKFPLDPFGSLIILHGLISVAWHFQQRPTGSLGNDPHLKELFTDQELLRLPKVAPLPHLPRQQEIIGK